MKKFIVPCLSAVSFLLSLWAVCHLSPNSYEVDWDYQGLLVGILSLLVTAILGWQIYNALTIEKRIERLSNLYHDISSKSDNLEEKMTCSKYYFDAMYAFMETSFNHRMDITNKEYSIGSLCNDYIRLMKSFELFLKAKNTKYPALCLINADSILSELSDMIKEGGMLPPQFNTHCDELYKSITNYISSLKTGDIDFFHEIRARRKSLSTDHHYPPATNPWGIKLS